MIQLFRHKGGPHPSKSKRPAEFYGLIGLVLLGFMVGGGTAFIFATAIVPFIGGRDLLTSAFRPPGPRDAARQPEMTP